MNLVDRIKGAFSQATQTLTIAEQAVAKAKAAVDELRADIATKKKARTHAEHGDLPPEEVKAKAAQWITTMADAHRRADPNRVIRAFGRPDKTDAWSFRDPMTWAEACRFFPQIVAASFEAEADAAMYNPGPPMAERPALVARLDAELRDLEQAEESLIDQHGKALGLEHRPEVAKRRRSREEEARRRLDRRCARSPSRRRPAGPVPRRRTIKLSRRVHKPPGLSDESARACWLHAFRP